MIILLQYVTMLYLMQNLPPFKGLILEVFGGLNLVSLSVFFGIFCLRNLGWFSHGHMFNSHIVQCHYLSVLIHFHVMHPNSSPQSVNIVSNLIFHCNNCDAPCIEHLPQFRTELGQWMPYNFVTDSFQAKKLCSTCFNLCFILNRKWPFCVFQPSLGGLGTTYNVYLRLIRKHVVDFLLLYYLCYH